MIVAQVKEDGALLGGLAGERDAWRERART